MLLAIAIVITGNRPGPDIGLGANAGIADIAQVIDLGPVFDNGLFNLDKVANLGPVTDFSPRTQTGIRTDIGPFANDTAFKMAKCLDHGVIAHCNTRSKHNIGFNNDVPSQFCIGTQKNRGRINQGRPLIHRIGAQTVLKDGLGGCQLRA